jgi:hypothetical protein
MGEFTPFPDPRDPQKDMPLVTPTGANYRCNGCGEEGDWHGMQIHPDIDENRMVTGIRICGDVNSPTVHACGTKVRAG